ncbi:MAG: DNA-formamidopyrimidine glycosylase family protein [Vulcanimicrobiota bacterium]
MVSSTASTAKVTSTTVAATISCAATFSATSSATTASSTRGKTHGRAGRTVRMPEGPDTKRAADAVAAAIEGRRLTRVELPYPPLAGHEEQWPGQTVEQVTSRGKALLIRPRLEPAAVRHRLLEPQFRRRQVARSISTRAFWPGRATMGLSGNDSCIRGAAPSPVAVLRFPYILPICAVRRALPQGRLRARNATFNPS